MKRLIFILLLLILILSLSSAGILRGGSFDGDKAGVMTVYSDSSLSGGALALLGKGLAVTLLLISTSAILGCILGFAFCLIRMTGRKVADAIVSFYVYIFQGIPLVVLLMILSYIVFPKGGVDRIWVAMIAATLNFTASMTELMHTSIKGVDMDQREVALALGFTRAGAFFKIIMPQAVRQLLPHFKSRIVSLLSMTSVVSFISVQDIAGVCGALSLNKGGALLPLLIAAVLYFILSYLLILMGDGFQMILESKRRRLRGVRP